MPRSQKPELVTPRHESIGVDGHATCPLCSVELPAGLIKALAKGAVRKCYECGGLIMVESTRTYVTIVGVK